VCLCVFVCVCVCAYIYIYIYMCAHVNLRLTFKVDFLTVNICEHEEVGHRSDLETVISQWGNLISGTVMAQWKVIDLNIIDMVLTPNIFKAVGPPFVYTSHINSGIY
jgi:hypothetical protein